VHAALRGSDQSYRTAARAAALANLVLGSVVLVGWLLGIERLSDLTFDGIRMKANAALALGLSGLSLLLLLPARVSSLRRGVGSVAAAVVLTIGALTLSEHVVGWDLGIDQLIAAEPAGQAATVSPGRMGPPASMSFTLLGTALLLLHSSWSGAALTRAALAFTVTVIALLSVVGNLHGAAQLYAVAHYTGISRQTALALFVQAVGVLCARPDEGPVRTFTSPLPGGVFLRRLVVPALVAPAMLGWLCVQAMQHGLFDAPFGFAVLAVALTVLLVATAARNGRALNDVSLQRLQAEQERELLLEGERHARVEMERSARLKDEFLATLSHELRTPLSAILGWSFLLGQKPGDHDTLAKGIEVIERNARHQSQLIEDLLDMSRIVSGKMHLHMQAVELPAVVEAAIQVVRPLAERKNVQIECDLARQEQSLIGDPTRLQQVVWNLLVNAVKFTPEGGTVRVRLDCSDTRATLTVADTGQGIAEDFLPHVFDRFRQANSSITREHGGLGIGLSIVKQLVEMHDGRVAVQSDGAGKGACFTVQLPLAQQAVAYDGMVVRAPAADPAAKTARIAFPKLAGISTLVLDDEADTLDVVRRLLTDCGADVTCARDADEALRHLRSRRFDVFVSDIGLPEKNGYELMRELRADGQIIPAVALSAYARPEDRQRALECGFQCHVPKPVEPAALLSTISSLL